ncbi:MAG TPA: L-histidine N(alpha)-methyltransferase [Candidatus Polarisedimenticolaceae bacterium]|nr:L-histidine N(alpha)-methyltransferase [Candidatus Polarisedimenticolaceae bacterium]
MPSSRVAIDVHLNESGAMDSIAREVREGLTAPAKRLPSKLFYDERGSELFERITELPEYYLTRAEQALLVRYAGRIATLTRYEELVELGSGSAKKTRTLLEAGLAAGSLRRFVPVDVSVEISEATARTIAEAYPGLAVHAVVADFEADALKVPPGRRRLVALLGSTIGNFARREAVALLRRFSALLDGDGRLLVGTDLVKDHAVLEAAYNDTQGVTAEFNLNILNVLNRQLDGDFDPDRFEHVAFFNEDESRIESYLKARTRHIARLEALGLDVPFAAGELLHTEVSCKYTRESVDSMLGDAGMELSHWFTDERATFALSLARRRRRDLAAA